MAAAAAAAYPCLTLAAAATKAHPSKEADIRARLVTTTVRYRCSSYRPSASIPSRLPAPQLHRAYARLPTSFTSSTRSLCVLATGSDLNADPERFTSTDEYSSSLPYAGGSFEGDVSSSLLTERLEVTSQLTESVPSSSAERLEEGGGGDANDGNSGDSGSGGSGSGGNSGRGEGQGEDGESSKKKKIITSQKITLAYALLIAMGGTIGYLKSKSTKSLISGVGSGLALLVVYSQLPSNPVFASSLGLGISAILLFVMGSRFKNSGKFFPAGVVSIASFIMTGGYIHGIMRTSHT